MRGNQIEWNYEDSAVINRLISEYVAEPRLIKDIVHHNFIGSLRVYFDDQAYGERLSFRYDECGISNKNTHEIYYRSVQREVRPTAHICNHNGMVRAVVNGWSFGYLKTCIHGISSLALEKFGFYPVHGGAFSIGNRGFLIIGGTGSGKTHFICSAIRCAMTNGSAVTVCSDDWGGVTIHNGEVYYSAIDNSMGISAETLDKNRVIFKKPCEYHRVGKIDAHPKEMHSTTVSNRIKITDLVMLEPRVHHCAGDFIIDGLDFFPYADDEHISNHKLFWGKCIEILKLHSTNSDDVKNFLDGSVW